MPAKPVSPDSPLAVTEDQKSSLREAERNESLSIVTIKGLAITDEGEVVKHNKYFHILSNTLDDYSDVQMTPEEARRFQRQMGLLATGSSATVPVLCQGDLCPWAERCPLWQIGKAPVGRQCLIELNIIKNAQFRYLNEYDVDPENYTEWTMVNQLSEIEVMLFRINQNMAKDPKLASGIADQTVGFDNQGNAITRQEVSSFIELQDRLYNRKIKLTKMLVGDRQEKYKREAALKKREDGDPSSHMANLRERMESLQRELDTARKDLPIDITAEVLESAGESGSTEKAIDAEPSSLSPDDVIVD